MRLLLAIMLLALPGQALGLAILPVSDDRLVTFQGPIPEPVQSAAPSPAFSPFAADLFSPGIGNATQFDSTVGTTSLSGTGNDFTDGAGDTAGETTYDVTFQVDELAQFAFDGFVAGDFGFFTLRLEGPGGAIFEPDLTGLSYLVFSETGLLTPGVDYRLVVSSSHPMNQGAVGPNEWSFDFVLSAPEPGAAPLLGLGALVFLRTRRAPRG